MISEGIAFVYCWQKTGRLKLGYSFIKVQKFNFVANIKYCELFRNTVNNGYSMTLIISPACLTRGTPAQIDARLYFTAHFADTPYPPFFRNRFKAAASSRFTVTNFP